MLKACVEGEENVSDAYVYKAFNAKEAEEIRGFAEAFRWVVESYNRFVNAPKEMKKLFSCIASSSPVCSYLFPSNECLDLMSKLFDRNCAMDAHLMKDLQEKLPIFFKALTSLLCKCFPEEFRVMLSTLTRISQEPYHGAKEVQKEKDDKLTYGFFPNLPIFRGRGSFKADLLNEKNFCTKKKAKHHKLVPGIFTVYCRHGKYF